MKQSIITILFLLFGFQIFNENVFSQVSTKSIQVKAPFNMPRIIIPDFTNSKTYSIADFGAIGDGKTNNSEAIKAAIEACNLAGGGRVIVPTGSYITGSVYLKSNVNLHLEKGSTLLFTTTPTDYLPLVQTRWEGIDVMNYSPLIYAYNEKNIAITGEGTLNGQASDKNWWPWKGRKDNGWIKGTPNQTEADKRPRLFNLAENDVPVKDRIFGEGFYLRPQFIQPYQCTNVLIEGVTITNSPMWIIHPVLCTNLVVRNVKVKSKGPNTDGCDPESCKNVLIENSYFNTGDDCIALKSGRNRDGRRINIPCENVVVRNCTMLNGHAGIGIGSEIGGGVKNILFENCVIKNTMWGIRLKTSSARGGKNSNIYINNVRAKNISNQSICITMLYEDKGNFMPTISDVQLKNIEIDGGGKEGIIIEGYPESPVKNILFENVNIKNVEVESRIANTCSLTFKNTVINGKNIKNKQKKRNEFKQ